MSSVFSGPFMQKRPFKSKPGRGSSTGNKIRLKGDYKEGDYVSEDDLEAKFKRSGGKSKDYPQLSVQDYSPVKVDEKGPYVVKIGDKLEK